MAQKKLSEVECLKLENAALKEKLKEFKLFRAHYALNSARLRETYSELDAAIVVEQRFRKALREIAEASELVKAGELRRYSRKVLDGNPV